MLSMCSGAMRARTLSSQRVEPGAGRKKRGEKQERMWRKERKRERKNNREMHQKRYCIKRLSLSGPLDDSERSGGGSKKLKRRKKKEGKKKKMKQKS